MLPETTAQVQQNENLREASRISSYVFNEFVQFVEKAFCSTHASLRVPKPRRDSRPVWPRDES
jgi:hypothetical protein